jgi:hypothetical protein
VAHINAAAAASFNPKNEIARFWILRSQILAISKPPGPWKPTLDPPLMAKQWSKFSLAGWLLHAALGFNENPVRLKNIPVNGIQELAEISLRFTVS